LHTNRTRNPYTDPLSQKKKKKEAHLGIPHTPYPKPESAEAFILHAHVEWSSRVSTRLGKSAILNVHLDGRKKPKIEKGGEKNKKK
jgi:hypothetical protein